MPVRSGSVKSTTARRSSVMVRLAATTSPFPSARAGSRRSRDVGMKTTCTRRFLVLTFRFSVSSKVESASYETPRGWPLSTK
jgi:hypothetical protein